MLTRLLQTRPFSGRLPQILRAVTQSDALSASALRILVASACLILSITDNDRLVLRYEPDDVISVSYFVFALAMAAAAARSPQVHYRIYIPAIIIDCIALVSFPYMGLPSPNDALILVAVASVSILLACSVRWNLRTAINVAVLLDTISIAIFTIYHPVGAAEDGAVARRIGFVLIPTVFGLWVATRIGAPRRPSLGIQAPELDLVAVRSIAETARKLLNCHQLSVEWATDDQQYQSLEHSQEHLRTARALAETLDPLPDNIAFLLPCSSDQGTLVVVDAWHIAPAQCRLPDQHDFPADLGGFAARVRSRNGSGMIVASGFPLTSWSDLRGFHAVADAILFQLDSLSVATILRDSELVQVRAELARDLHDSVAQSLAGAKFWLAGLASSATDLTMRGELSRLRDAIEAESRNVRHIVASLRDGNPGSERSTLQHTVQDTLAALSRQWRVRTDLAFEFEVKYRASPATTFAVQQILREAIANAVRHGRAEIVLVRCAPMSEGLLLEIIDNGSGFADPVQPRSLAERVARLDGDLQVSSRGGETMVSITLPVGVRSDESADSR